MLPLVCPKDKLLKNRNINIVYFMVCCLFKLCITDECSSSKGLQATFLSVDTEV